MALTLNQRLIDTGEYCYVNFFSKKYALTDKEKFPQEGDYQGHVIQRPNHGLAHTLRKIYYFPLMTTLFALKGITTFSIGQITVNISTETENMLTAYFFSVVGRESEASYKDDPQNYTLFRKKSAQAYEDYILSKRKLIPAYELLVTSKKIDFYKDLIEFPHVNAGCTAKRLFNLCHGLDLARCYKADQYASILEGIISDLAREEGQKKFSLSLISKELQNYAIFCLEATGNVNRVKGTPYEPSKFIASSMSVKTCTKALSHVSLPSFMPILAPIQEKIAPFIPYAQVKAVPQALPKVFPQAPYAPKVAPQAAGYGQPKVMVPAPYGQPVAKAPPKSLPHPVAPKIDTQTAKYEKAKQQFSKKEYKAALAEFESLAISGHSKSSYQAGMCHYSGEGASVNYNKAYTHFYTAAQSKHPHALYMVGRCAYYGRGCSKDLERAKRYFQEAVNNGSLEAKKALTSLF